MITVLSFPISILWSVNISIRKKLILGGIFGLVGFTIAVTIVRGSIFGGVYKSINADGGSELNVSWIWFWLYVEYTVCKLSTLNQTTVKQQKKRPSVLTFHFTQPSSLHAAFPSEPCSSNRSKSPNKPGINSAKRPAQCTP